MNNKRTHLNIWINSSLHKSHTDIVRKFYAIECNINYFICKPILMF